MLFLHFFTRPFLSQPSNILTAMTGPRRRSREQSNAKSFSDGVPSGHDTSQLDADPGLKSDIDHILTALQEVRQKTISDAQKKSDELIARTAAEVRSLIEEAKNKIETEREVLSKQTSKTCKEYMNMREVQYEAALKGEAFKYKTAYAAFCEAKDSHLTAYEGIFTKFEECKEKLLSKYDQLRKKEKAAYNNLQVRCTQKFDEAEQNIKKMKQDESSFQMLRKSLGTILEDSSDEEADITAQ